MIVVSVLVVVTILTSVVSLGAALDVASAPLWTVSLKVSGRIAGVTPGTLDVLQAATLSSSWIVVSWTIPSEVVR